MTPDEPSDELTSTTTKVICGTTRVVQTEVRFFHNTKNKADTDLNPVGLLLLLHRLDYSHYDW
jgi:hypothetical protein